MNEDTKKHVANRSDFLQYWRSRHARERKILAVLEIDWPGTQDVCRNAIDYVLQQVPEAENRDRVVERCLSAALNAYRVAVHDRTVSDRGRLGSFLGALLVELRTRVTVDHPIEPELIRRLVPAHLRKTLGDEGMNEGRDAA
jgi:hypothetical protein